MLYIHQTYGKGRKLMAVGTSLGAHRLCLALGEDGKSSPLHAACCVQAPMKLWKATKTAKYTMKGIYDKKLGDNMKTVLMKHIDVLQPHLLETHGINLEETLSRPITQNEIDDLITSKCFGYKDGYDYHYNGACCHRIKDI